MAQSLISTKTIISPQFYDMDPMKVVWHGNYVKYFERGRCDLLDKIGYSYEEMEASGYSWPVVDLRVKYIESMIFHRKGVVLSELLEYENRLKIRYTIFDEESGRKVTKGETTQMCVRISDGETFFESPLVLKDRVEALCAKTKGE